MATVLLAEHEMRLFSPDREAELACFPAVFPATSSSSAASLSAFCYYCPHPCQESIGPVKAENGGLTSTKHLSQHDSGSNDCLLQEMLLEQNILFSWHGNFLLLSHVFSECSIPYLWKTISADSQLLSSATEPTVTSLFLSFSWCSVACNSSQNKVFWNAWKEQIVFSLT